MTLPPTSAEAPGRARMASLRWIMQAALGVLLVLLLAVHLIVNHLVAPDGLLTYAQVIAYYDLPGIVLMEALFLGGVTAHCLLGLHSVLMDLNPGSALTRLISVTLTGLGFAALAYGVWLLMQIAAR